MKAILSNMLVVLLVAFVAACESASPPPPDGATKFPFSVTVNGQSQAPQPNPAAQQNPTPQQNPAAQPNPQPQQAPAQQQAPAPQPGLTPGESQTQGQYPSRQQKLWALGLAAILIEGNGGSHELLGGDAKTDASARDNRQLLANGWGVNSREDLLKTLNWLDIEGHRRMFDALMHASDEQLNEFANSGDPENAARLAVVRASKAGQGPGNIDAWDFGRYVVVCGAGYLAGYLSEDEAWKMIMPIALRSQHEFKSWKEFGDDYMTGRRFWSPQRSAGADGSAMMQAYARVQDSNGAWSHFPWDTDLADPGTKP